MQTSSCDKFNETFRHMQNAAEYNKTLKKSITVQYPDPDQILEAAENKYVQLTLLQQWDGVTTKGSPSGFILENSNCTCFNCGDPGHIVPTCSKPKNEELIQKQRKEFQDKKAASKKQNLSQNTSTKNSNDRKKSNRPGKGKWTPPKQGEGPRRDIDNKPMFYNKRTKRWVPDRNPPAASTQGANQAANASAPLPAPAPAAASAPALGNQPAGNIAINQAATSNATHAVHEVMTRLENALFSES